ncbi:hypothetical protein FKM82_030441 [Ascaphus truei]
MASAGLREELTCPICLSIYTQPVMLRCGHNFCQGCIGSVWDSQGGSGLYTCPECRAEFQERPALQRNLKLCNIAERFLSTQPEQEEAVIFCTYCVTSSVPAAKTCLLCDASLCDIHLERHSKSEEHVLTEPTTFLKTRKCPVHKEILKCYCTEDAACICVSCCVFGEHRGHQVESLNEASEKKKEKLRHVLEKLTSVREETEKRAQSLQERRREAQEKAAGETARVTALIRDIREQLEVLEKRALSEITRREEQVSLPVSGLIQQLEIKKDELSRKMLHIEELSNITDPVTVLQGRESDNADFCDAEEGDNKDRERERENITGRWRSGERGVGISYPSIERKGRQSLIGDNKKSWGLYMWDNIHAVIHDSIETQIYPDSPSQRLGIYLDYEAGRLSFYQLCDPIRHLHTVTATFTEPLHAAFWVWNYGWVRIRS